MHSFRSTIAKGFKNKKTIQRMLNNENQSSLNHSLKDFDSIPGPRRLPLVGNLHLFSRFGPYSFDKLYDAYGDLFHKYGPVVRLELGISMLALFNPEDIQNILVLNDQYPERPLLQALKHYRLNNKEKYASGGLVSENGEEWKRLRDAVNFIMFPKFVEQYFPAHEEVAEDFVKRISRIRNPDGQVRDFLQELYRFTEEAIGLLCFGLRLGLMDDSCNADFCARITKASDDTLQSFADTFLGLPWWKIWKTKPYKKLEESQDFFHKFASECIKKADSKLKDPSNQDDVTLQFYKTLSENSKIDPKDIGLLMTELFSAGIDATGNQIGYTLYNLAVNPGVQQILYEEIKTYAPVGQPLTKNAVGKMRYLRACIKESYRLTPTSGGTARILKTPTEVSGYLVPANVLCIGINPIVCLQDDIFQDAQKFKPERWLIHTEPKPHPFCVLPFSHGVRRCVGQRFAEQEIKICLIKVLQNFKITYNGPPIGRKMRLLLVPDKPLNFVFENRT